MSEDMIRYDVWIEDALRGVVRRALLHTAEYGLPGEHHFYITFETEEEGVQMPDYLRAQHSEEMTIVLQHQFEDLFIEEDRFGVTLYFKGKAEHLVVPFAAISGFADPSVNFGLQLKMVPAGEGEEGEEGEGEDGTEMESVAPAAEVASIESAQTKPSDDDAPDESAASDGTAEVIALDTFRKK